MVVPADISDPLLAECFGRLRAYRELQWLCDHVGGRTSGMWSGEQTEEWAHRLFTEWGLEQVRYEPFQVLAWQRGTLHAAVREPVSWTLTALSHGYAPCEAYVTAEAVDVGHGERHEFERARDTVKGRIALCDEGATEGKRRLHRSEKLGMAVEFGAAGLMILSSAPGGLPRTGVCYYVESPIPSLGISMEDGERLRRVLANGATPVVRIQMSNRMQEGTARNVLAGLPGSEQPEQVVLLGAHGDSWDVAQGATDNGLGVAIVLEAAKALAALPRRPRRTVRFAVWAAEEIGLLGSWQYSRKHEVDLPSHTAVMNFDMTGDPHGFWTPGRKEPGPMLQGLAEQLGALGIRREFRSHASLHSDHQPFMLAGVPVVGLVWEPSGQEGAHYYHSAGDTFEKVSQPALARAAAVAAHTAWALADAPEPPFAHLDAAGVRAMIDEADLHEALVAEGYNGPPMSVR